MNWGDTMAGTVLAAAPMIVVFVVLQRRFIEGLTAGSIKGSRQHGEPVGIERGGAVFDPSGNDAVTSTGDGPWFVSTATSPLLRATSPR